MVEDMSTSYSRVKLAIFLAPFAHCCSDKPHSQKQISNTQERKKPCSLSCSPSLSQMLILGGFSLPIMGSISTKDCSKKNVLQTITHSIGSTWVCVSSSRAESEVEPDVLQRHLHRKRPEINVLLQNAQSLITYQKTVSLGKVKPRRSFISQMEPAAASEAAAAVVPERPPKVDGVLEWQCLVSHRDDS